MESDECEDKILIQKLKGGDERSFRKTYVKYHRQLYSVALKYLRSKELAEDAVHDVFLKLWNNRKKMDATRSLKGFLFTAVKNHVLNMISSNKRKLKKQVELSYEKKMNNLETANVVPLLRYRELYQKAVKKLPEKRRKIFELRTDEGLTNREVAQYLSISIHTVKSQYYKASKFIREDINEHIKVGKTGS